MSRALLAIAARSVGLAGGGLWRHLAAAAVGFAVLDLLLLRAGAAAGLSGPQNFERMLRASVLAQSLLVALVAPGLAIGSLARERRSGTLALLLLSRWRSAAILAANATPPLLRALALTVGAGLALWPLAAIMGAGRTVARLALAQLELCWMAAAFVALGLLCSSLLRRESSAAALAYLVVLAMVAAPLLIGPGIERLADAGGLAEGALLVSPVTALSSALEFDLMRTERVYRLSPIGQRRFSYPSPGAVLLLQLSILALAFAGSVWRFAAERRGRAQ